MLPVLARIGPVTVYTHDVFTVLGFLAGMALYYRALRRDQLLEPQITIISIAALTGGVVGAHLLTRWEVLGAVSAAGCPLPPS